MHVPRGGGVSEFDSELLPLADKLRDDIRSLVEKPPVLEAQKAIPNDSNHCKTKKKTSVKGRASPPVPNGPKSSENSFFPLKEVLKPLPKSKEQMLFHPLNSLLELYTKHKYLLPFNLGILGFEGYTIAVTNHCSIFLRRKWAELRYQSCVDMKGEDHPESILLKEFCDQPARNIHEYMEQKFALEKVRRSKEHLPVRTFPGVKVKL